MQNFTIKMYLAVRRKQKKTHAYVCTLVLISSNFYVQESFRSISAGNHAVQLKSKKHET